MREVTIQIFKASELNESAKDTAYYNWLESYDYPWERENKNTLEAFERIFPISANASYDQTSHHVRFEFEEDECIENLSGLRLAKYLWNNYKHELFKGRYYSISEWIDGNFKNKFRHSKIMLDDSCVLTGYYLDDEILAPIYEFLNKPNENINFSELMRDCLDAWGKACSKDYDTLSSKDYFIEQSDENDFEYDKHGRVA